MERHFTATTFIVYQNKTLLHRHKKLGILLPPGGHVDPGELPHEAALREVKEETGLEVELLFEDPLKVEDVQVLPRPRHVILIDINPDHKHIDLCFFARSHTDKITPAPGESQDWFWADAEEVSRLEMADNVQKIALEALERLKS